MRQRRLSAYLLATVFSAGMAHQAFAQDVAPQAAPVSPNAVEPASTTPTAPESSAQITSPQNQEIVVTGSVFRRKDTETPSPVTIITATQLAQRGITTASDAVMSLSSAGGGGIPSSFSANGAFAAGAVGVSLRGLTTDSTLVLQDGMRMAYYPLADDGARSFVDLNTIPDAVIDRVDVLKDGASATYGADAIAGVVNYIMKKQITGVSGTIEGGISQHKDDGEQRATLTAGYGDLQSQGFNVYVSGEFQHNAALYNRDRGFPYNTNNLSSRLADDGKTPDVNGDVNGSGFQPTAGATTSAVVAPAIETTPGNVLSGQQLAGSNAMVLNPAGCGAGTTAAASSGDAYCTEDIANRYRAISPSETRMGLTSRLTVNVGDQAQAYLMGTYYQNHEVLPSFGGPVGTSSISPTSLQGLVLPAILANGTINPQDPYANIIDPATGQRESAILQYAFGQNPSYVSLTTRNYRIAGGISGTFGNDWHYDFGGTYMHAQTDSSIHGAPNYEALIDAIENGTYNFVNPGANSQAALNALAPTIDATAKSNLWQVQGTITKDLLELPGGALQFAVSGQVRYEDINDPNEDPANTGAAAAADGVMFAAANINSFNAIGHRYNEAGSFELDAPILKQVEVDASGRFDHYSEGFSHFSPKVGVKFTPVKQLILRGTFSKGFRAPSIPETSGSVLGFVTETPPASVVAAHASNPGYVAPYSLGLNTAGNPNLKPELSTSFTGGAVVNPTDWLSLSGDFYHIKKKRVIVGGPDYGDAIDAYYNGTALPAGYSVVLNPADPQNPNAVRTIAIVNSPYENANSLITSGVDMSATATYRIAPGIKFFSTVEGSWIQKYNIHTDNGVQHFAGTVGPYAITSASGTPRWRANWQNTLSIAKWTMTATAYYTSGYKGVAPDSGAGTTDTCASAIATTGGVPEKCHVGSFLDVDLVVSYKVTDKFSLFGNVYNVGNAKAPFDPNTYGGVNYNPAWSTAGIVGRYFKVGANFGF